MPVANSRQNRHGWWGTLTIDPNTEDREQLEVGQRCIFIKTRRESHYVTEGTFIKKVHVFRDIAEAEQSLGFYIKDYPSIREDLKKITTEYPEVTAFVEILQLDNEQTTPLAQKLNIYTLMLFTLDTKWFNENGDKIGKGDVQLGLGLPPMEESSVVIT